MRILTNSSIPRLIRIVPLHFCLVIPFSATTFGQADRAIVILLPNTASSPGCQGDTEIEYKELYGLKINGKGDLRLLPSVPLPAPPISRSDWDQGKSIDLKHFVQIIRRSNAFVGDTSGQGRYTVVVPSNLKPEKKIDTNPTDFYRVLLEGEAREGKSKRKENLNLNSVWKIFLLQKQVQTEEAVYRHAREENTVAYWKAYLRTITSHRTGEATVALSQALLDCSRSALATFKNGDLKAALDAQAFAEEAGQVSPNPAIEEWKADIDSTVGKVMRTIAEVKKFKEAGEWDQAIDAGKTVEAYFGQDSELAKAYAESLKQSHDLHLDMGRKAFDEGHFEIALAEFEKALTRLSTSAALDGKKQAEVQITLAKSKELANQPCEARKVVLERLEQELHAGDPTLSQELSTTSCSCAQQIYEQARVLVSTPPPAKSPSSGQGRRGSSSSPESPGTRVTLKKINSADGKKPFKEARNSLKQAVSLCTQESFSELLSRVNSALGQWHADYARSALKRSAPGTAYLFATAAQSFDPEHPNLTDLIDQSWTKLEEKARVDVAIIPRSRGRSRIYGASSDDLLTAVESGLTKTGLIINLSSEQLQMTAQRSNPRTNLFVELTKAEIRPGRVARSVPSSMAYSNPDWERLKNREEQLEGLYKTCKKTYGEQGCLGQKQEYEGIKKLRENTKRCLERPYSYGEAELTLTGEMEASLTIQDNLGSAVSGGELISAQTEERCLERFGVSENDLRNVRECHGWLPPAPIGDQSCHLDEANQLQQLIQQVRNQAEHRATQSIRQLASRFFASANAPGTSREAALEIMTSFLFMSTDRGGSDVGKAIQFIKSFDEDLQIEEHVR